MALEVNEIGVRLAVGDPAEAPAETVEPAARVQPGAVTDATARQRQRAARSGHTETPSGALNRR